MEFVNRSVLLSSILYGEKKSLDLQMCSEFLIYLRAQRVIQRIVRACVCSLWAEKLLLERDFNLNNRARLLCVRGKNNAEISQQLDWTLNRTQHENCVKQERGIFSSRDNEQSLMIFPLVFLEGIVVAMQVFCASRETIPCHSFLYGKMCAPRDATKLN